MFAMTTQPMCLRQCGASLRGSEGRARLVVRAQAPKVEGVRAAIRAVRWAAFLLAKGWDRKGEACSDPVNSQRWQ